MPVPEKKAAPNALDLLASHVDRLETNVESLATSVRSLAEATSTNNANIRNLVTWTENAAKDLKTLRPSTGTVVAVLSLTVAIITAIGGLISFAIFTPIDRTTMAHRQRIEVLEHQMEKMIDRSMEDARWQGRGDVFRDLHFEELKKDLRRGAPSGTDFSVE